MSTTITPTIAADADDGNTTTAPAFSNTSVVFGDDTAETRNSFFRFATTNIPPGAAIVSAKITFTALQNRAVDDVNCRIFANDVDNSTAPTNAAEHNALVRTTASVDWDAIEAWTAETEYDTPDFTVVIQEVVNRAGWASGNALTVLIDENGSDSGALRVPYDFNDDTNKDAVLTVVYDDFVTREIVITQF
jgi:hypothetical protein